METSSLHALRYKPSSAQDSTGAFRSEYSELEGDSRSCGLTFFCYLPEQACTMIGMRFLHRPPGGQGYVTRQVESEQDIALTLTCGCRAEKAINVLIARSVCVILATVTPTHTCVETRGERGSEGALAVQTNAHHSRHLLNDICESLASPSCFCPAPCPTAPPSTRPAQDSVVIWWSEEPCRVLSDSLHAGDSLPPLRLWLMPVSVFSDPTPSAQCPTPSCSSTLPSAVPPLAALR